MKPNLFQYLNYREYLNDWCEYARKNHRGFSYRKLSQQIGLNSPNAVQWVIQRKRHLDATTLLNTAKALGLKGGETDFFELLVYFDQAKSLKEKDRYYRKITRNPQFAKACQLEKFHYRYFEHWYHPVVWELAIHEKFGNNLKWMAQRIYPRISQSQIRGSLQLLERLKLIIWDKGNKKWRHTNEVLRTQPEAEFLLSSKYHRQFMELASQSIDSFSPRERDIRGVTLKISPENIPAIKKKLTRFWEEMMEVSAMQGETDHVYQFNLQFFPLVKPPQNPDGNS